MCVRSIVLFFGGGGGFILIHPEVLLSPSQKTLLQKHLISSSAFIYVTF